jgi:hypothetical protein
VLEGLTDRENDHALIISFDSVNSSAVIESYTLLSSLDSSTLSCAYLSACDHPGLLTTCNNIDSFDSTFNIFTSIKNGLIKTQKHLDHSANIFLSSKKKYKPIAKKIHPVIGELPKKFRIKRKIIGDPLDTIPTLNPNPLTFKPTNRYTLEQCDRVNKNHPGDFLWSAERDLMHDFIKSHNTAFAWSKDEKGSFRTDFFPPVDIPVIYHTPWVERNFPIPPGLYEEVCSIIQKKIVAGIYEPSNSSY